MATISSIVAFVQDFNQFFNCPSNNGKCKGMFLILWVRCCNHVRFLRAASKPFVFHTFCKVHLTCLQCINIFCDPAWNLIFPYILIITWFVHGNCFCYALRLKCIMHAPDSSCCRWLGKFSVKNLSKYAPSQPSFPPMVVTFLCPKVAVVESFGGMLLILQLFLGKLVLTAWKAYIVEIIWIWYQRKGKFV